MLGMTYGEWVAQGTTTRSPADSFPTNLTSAATAKPVTKRAAEVGHKNNTENRFTQYTQYFGASELNEHNFGAHVSANG